MMTENTDKSNRWKSAGIIILTLIIGIVLGGLVTTRIVNKRMEDISTVRSQRGFTRFIEKSIEYESDEQRQEVAKILDRTAESMFQHLRLSRRQSRDILDSARTELSGVLSEEQMKKIEKRLRRHGRDRPMGPQDGPPRKRRRP
jgi:uncharacterized membrane-anchored protein YhcB (DUF1043 family)